MSKNKDPKKTTGAYKRMRALKVQGKWNKSFAVTEAEGLLLTDGYVDKVNGDFEKTGVYLEKTGSLAEHAKSFKSKNKESK